MWCLILTSVTQVNSAAFWLALWLNLFTCYHHWVGISCKYILVRCLMNQPSLKHPPSAPNYSHLTISGMLVLRSRYWQSWGIMLWTRPFCPVLALYDTMSMTNWNTFPFRNMRIMLMKKWFIVNIQLDKKCNRSWLKYKSYHSAMFSERHVDCIQSIFTITSTYNINNS